MKLFISYLGLILWHSFGKYLPKSTIPVFGLCFKKIRAFIVKLIFKKVGKNVNVENHCNFGSGRNIIIGDNSGIGKRCKIPSNIVIGNNVMMAEEIINVCIDSINKYVDEIASGKFNLSDLEDRENKVCRYCNFRSICRIQEVN